MILDVRRCFRTPSLVALVAGAAVSMSPNGARADDVYWVGYQNDVLGPNYPDVGSFFHADNWLNYTGPGINDTAIFGSSVQNPINPGHRPHLLYFGNFNLRIPGMGDQFIAGGDAELGRLDVQSDSWIFDFGSGSGNGASPPSPSTGSLTIAQQTIIGSVQDENASLTIRNGHLDSQFVVHMGTATGSHGIVNVDGNNARWDVAGYIDLGWVGDGTIRVRDGASMHVVGGIVAGIRDGTTGRLEVTTGAQFTSESNLSFGSGHESPSHTARGEVLVSGANSRLSAPSMNIGSGEASGSAVFADHASVMLNDWLQVQSSTAAGATLAMSSGATLTTGWASVGRGLGSPGGWSGQASLTGIGTRLVTADYLEIGGDGGHGLVKLDHGAAVEVGGDLNIGLQGNGLLQAIHGSSIVANSNVFVGTGVESQGLLELAGSNTTLTLTASNSPGNGLLHIGSIGSRGRAEVRDGAHIAGVSVLAVGFLGSASNLSDGALVVTGSNSSVESTRISVGVLDAQGSLSITDGARVVAQATSGFPGFQAGVFGTAEVEVRGTGSLLQSNQGIVLGDASNGMATFVLAEHASVVAADEGINIGYSGRGTLSIESGATASSKYGRIGRATGSVGSVTISGDGSAWNVTDNLFVGGHTLTGEGGSGTLVVRDEATISVATTVETWSSGTIDISQNGRMLVGAGDISLVTSGSFEIGSGGVLAGTGTVIGNLFNNGGTIRPGHSPGTLSLVGDLFLGSLGVLDMEIGGPSAGMFDTLSVSGMGSLDGTLRLSFIDGYVPTSIFSIDIITAGEGLTGMFSSVQFIGVDPSLVSTSFHDGAFSVNVVPAPGVTAFGVIGGFAMARRRARLR